MEVSEPVLLILLSLAEQPRHGYAILQDTERMSDGRVRLSTGTLYGALARLLDEKWIERFKEQDNSRGKQAYRLTAAGRRNLQMEVARLKHLTRVAELRETGGLLYGAAREHFYTILGSQGSGMLSLRRRNAMRSEFRFPKATVGLMVAILAAVMFTIEKAKAISASIPHANPPVGPIHSVEPTIVQTFLATLVWAITAGAIGWGILYALRRTGVQTLSEMKPTAGQNTGK